MRIKLLFLAGLVWCSALFAAIPEQWFVDKAEVGSGTREVLFATFPRKHIAIAQLPEVYRTAFKNPPDDLTIYVGEAYFIDHCLNHHPDVGDEIYRQVQAILDTPDEAIIDRRKGGDALVFAKRFEEQSYALVIRNYNGEQLVYKTLFPVGKKLYPKLPRWTGKQRD